MRRLFGRRARQRDDDDREEQIPVEDYAGDEGAGYGTEEFEPFVPVERRYEVYEAYGAGDEDDVAHADSGVVGDAEGYGATQTPPDNIPRRRARVPRLGVPRMDVEWTLRWDMLLLVVVLIAAGIFGTLLVRGDLTDEVNDWWPVALTAAAVVWMLAALVRRQAASFLGAAAFAGVGLSLLMDAQEIARFEETLFGVVLVTVGLGIVIRGFLLRQRETF